MKTKSKMVNFNKLEAEFKKRGLRSNAVAMQIGRNPGYFSGMKAKGYLPEATILMLDSILNIKYEDIEPLEVEQPSVEATERASAEIPITMTKEELRYIITEAVKDAFVWYANM